MVVWQLALASLAEAGMAVAVSLYAAPCIRRAWSDESFARSFGGFRVERENAREEKARELESDRDNTRGVGTANRPEIVSPNRDSRL